MKRDFTTQGGISDTLTSLSGRQNEFPIPLQQYVLDHNLSFRLQLGELVEKLAELEAELAESKKARSALQQKAEQLEHSQQTLAQTSSKMQQQIDLLKREKEQVLLPF